MPRQPPYLHASSLRHHYQGRQSACAGPTQLAWSDLEFRDRGAAAPHH